jgi:hypothetical protein
MRRPLVLKKENKIFLIYISVGVVTKTLIMICKRIVLGN